MKLIRKDLCVKLWKCDRLNGSGQIMHSGKNVDLHVKFPTLEEVAGHEGMGYKAYAFCINIIMTTWFYNRK